MRHTFHNHNGQKIAVINLAGMRLDKNDLNNFSEICAYILSFLDPDDQPLVVLDLTSSRAINVYGLTSLSSLLDFAARCNGRIVLLVSQRVARLMEKSGFNSVFDYYTNLSKALKSF